MNNELISKKCKKCGALVKVLEDCSTFFTFLNN